MGAEEEMDRLKRQVAALEYRVQEIGHLLYGGSTELPIRAPLTFRVDRLERMWLMAMIMGTVFGGMITLFLGLLTFNVIVG
jgi:hypothetical protein